MACRKGELRDDGKGRNTAAAASMGIGDALLFTTMCIIGLPVDVHVKDGSLYHGIFHTASVDKDYAIVLKKARMIKKGNLDANVANGTLIETLIVRSEDLVQVVAKGILLPSNGITGHIVGDGIEAAGGYNEYLDRDAELVKPKEFKENGKYKSQSRFSAKRENNYPYTCTEKTTNLLVDCSEDHIKKLDTMKLQKIEEAHNVSVDRRHIRDGLQQIQNDCHNNPEFQDKRIVDEAQGSSPSITSCQAQWTAGQNILDDSMQQEPKRVSFGCFSAIEDQGQEQPPSDDTSCTVAPQPNVSAAPMPLIDTKSESCLSASSNPFVLVPSKSSGVNRTVKESKLNPGAKIFSPSKLHNRAVTPSAVPNGTNASYMAGSFAMATMATAPEEVDSSSFPPVPVKFVPYNNAAFAHGGNAAPYVQPIIGQMVSRMQPVRYPGQFQNFQTGPAYVHHNPQNGVFGRVGPLVCVHPISSDVVQSAAGFSAASTRPLLTPHQLHLPKHQGNASVQSLQLCMTPPIIASGPQQYTMPNSIPISQPGFPLLRPIAVPGSNSFLSSKFA